MFPLLSVCHVQFCKTNSKTTQKAESETFEISLGRYTILFRMICGRLVTCQRYEYMMILDASRWNSIYCILSFLY